MKKTFVIAIVCMFLFNTASFAWYTEPNKMDYNSVSVKLPKDNQSSFPGDNTPAVDWLHDPANASDSEFGQCVSAKGLKVDIDKYINSLEVIDGKEIRTVKSKINGKILMEFNKKTGILTVKSESGDRKVDLSEAAFSKFRNPSSNFTSDYKFSYTVCTEYQGTNEIHFWKLTGLSVNSLRRLMNAGRYIYLNLVLPLIR